MTELNNTQQPKQFSVLLVGDSCVDEYCYGSIDRLSPEAPVPVMKFSTTVTNPGMAANVKENLLAFGLEVDFTTNGEQIIKTRYVEIKSGQHLLRVDTETELLPWSGHHPFALSDYDAIVISDYNKGFVTYEAIENLRLDFEGPIFVDTKKQDLARFNGCYVKINESEYRASTSKCRDLIVTKGGQGAMYQDVLYATVKQDVVDVCGAGDTFLAALAYEFLNTNSIVQAIHFANRCSAITVGHRGVYALSNKDIQKVKSQ